MRSVYINLLVRDIPASRAFYRALGFTINEQFSDDTAACVVISDTIHVMIMERSRFQGFIVGEIAPQDTTEVLNCLSCESRDEVDLLVTLALDNGGRTWKPALEMDVMYGGSFQDPDGHVWELTWMDPAAFEQTATEDAAAV